jgi:hypothetical protein
VKRPTSPLPTYNAIDSLHLNSTEQTTRLMRSAHATLNIQPGTPASPLPTELLASGNISARKSLKSTPVLAHISPSSRVPGSATSASAIPASINSPGKSYNFLITQHINTNRSSYSSYQQGQYGPESSA